MSAHFQSGTKSAALSGQSADLARLTRKARELQQADPEQAADLLLEALQLAPGRPDLVKQRVRALHAAQRHVEALEFLNELLASRSDDVPLLIEIANALFELGQGDLAFDCLGAAMDRTNDPAALTALVEQVSAIAFNAGNWTRALDLAQREVEMAPTRAGARYRLGHSLIRRGRAEEGLQQLEKACALAPENESFLASLLHEYANRFCWGEMAQHVGRIEVLGAGDQAIAPFSLIGMDDDPARLLQRNQLYRQAMYPAEQRHPFMPPAARPKRLKIGYFSADFADHATLHLMIHMFDLLDRDRFETHLFSFGPFGDDPMRARLMGMGFPFYDVSGLTDQDIAKAARQLGLDIAIDLKGYTTHCRPAIFAHRAAPIQISYLGYPASMGADFIDYAIADNIVLPVEDHRYWREKIITLPRCYQVNDGARGPVTGAVERRELGLPEDGFVFASFNASFKITPVEMASWARILEAVPGSVLWLMATDALSQRNLLENAVQFGIAPDRLVLAERVALEDHLARHRAADLFLDSFACSAHTTGSDALRAGLPVLTKRGRAFHSRVAASLLSAVGLDSLVADSVESYEQMAITLGNTPEMCRVLRAHLDEAHYELALFDTRGFVGYFERGLDMAYDRYLTGRGPADIDVCAATAP